MGPKYSVSNADRSVIKEHKIIDIIVIPTMLLIDLANMYETHIMGFFVCICASQDVKLNAL